MPALTTVTPKRLLQRILDTYSQLLSRTVLSFLALLSATLFSTQSLLAQPAQVLSTKQQSAFSSSHQLSAEQLIAASGFVSLISQLPLHFERGIRDAHERNPSIKKSESELLTTARQAMQQARVQQQLASAVARALNTEEIEQLLEWYRSPPGLHISAAQAHAASEAGFKDMMAQVNQLLQKPLLTSTAQRLENLIGFNEFIIDMQEYHAMAEYSTASLAEHRQFDLDTFGDKMKTRREELQFNAEQLVLVSMSYAFRDTSTDDLKAYEHFLQQPLTQLYLKAAMRGLEVGMQQTVNNWLTALDHH